MIAFLYADLAYRQIFMDGRELEPDPLPVWMGYSVGRWDGDTNLWYERDAVLSFPDSISMKWPLASSEVQIYQ